jgi:hypothetical protein
MIIAISSPPPIDKTELAKKLATQYGLTIVEDPAPTLCREYGFQTIYDMPQQLQAEIRERLIREHTAFLKVNDNLVLKFSIFEFLADWMRWFWANTPTEKWEDLLAVAHEASGLYTEIHHLDDGQSLEYDGYVWFDKFNSKQINSLIKQLYTEMQVGDELK